jgi:alpha-N-arabinofuranosidase
MGKLRAANGHPEPFNIRYWEIGNELYGKWQIGHCTAEEYALRYREFVEAMRRRDPKIRFIANGDNLDWNEPLVERCPDILRSVSLHTLIGGGMPETTAPEKVWWSVAGYPWEYRHQLQQLSDQLRNHVPRGVLAITELQIFTNRANLPNNAGLAEALFWAGTVNTAVRAGDRVEMITHSALVNHGGGLRKQREVVYPNPVYLARKLYATQPGRWPVAVRVEGAAFSTTRLHNLPAVQEAPLLDVLALTSDAGDKLVLLVTNRHAHDPMGAEVTLAGFTPARRATWQWITGDSILAANSLENPRAVKRQQRTLLVPGPHFQATFPARSLSAITLSKKKSSI